MPSNVIQFIIKAIDNTKSAFASAGRGIKKFADGSMAVLKKLGNYAKWAFVGVAAGVTLAVREYLNYSRAVAKLEIALTRENRQNEITKQSLLDLADELQKTTGVEDEAVINAEAILLTYKKLSGDVIPRVIRAIVDMNAQMTDGDLSMGGLQASAVQLGKALSDPKKGILLLARAGVILDKEQKKAIKSALAHKDLSKAQTLILGALEEKYAGVAAAISKSQAGVDRVKGSFGDLAKEIGRVVLIGLGFEKGMESVSRWIDDLTESGKIADWTASIIVGLRKILELARETGGYLSSIFRNAEGEMDIGGGFLQLGKDLGLGLLKVVWSGAKRLGILIAEAITASLKSTLKWVFTSSPEDQIKKQTQMEAEKSYQNYMRRYKRETTGEILDPTSTYTPSGENERQHYRDYVDEAVKILSGIPTAGKTQVEEAMKRAKEQLKWEEENELNKIAEENKRRKSKIDLGTGSILDSAIRNLDEGRKQLQLDSVNSWLNNAYKKEVEGTGLIDATIPSLLEEIRDANNKIVDNLVAK